MMSAKYLHAFYGSSCMIARLASIETTWSGKISKHSVILGASPFCAADNQEGAGQSRLTDGDCRDVSGHLSAYSRSALVVRLPGDEADVGRPIGLFETSEYATSQSRAKGMHSRSGINGMRVGSHAAQISDVRFLMPRH